MLVNWKPIITEILLETILQFAPAGLDTLANVAEFLLDCSWETSKSSVEIVSSFMNQPSNTMSPLINII
ncbi:MAG: hypothetical protein KME64_16470 [Scytonematopsis contorta HA4267-MV1]|jgi:hypothetical protein|nr:hypothetical protein [Scytonematopsis contorta HA4267-MV1]